MSDLLGFEPDDFSPGDRGKSGPDWSEQELHRVFSPEHPLFSVAYGLLWEQFGAACEMEERGVILHRLKNRGQPAVSTPVAAASMGSGAAERPAVCPDRTFYEMDLILAGEEPAAVRDHTVILPGEPGPFSAIVHLSHNLVLPAWRRSGLAAWMRALPVRAARECLQDVEKRVSADAPIVLAAEMEPLDVSLPARMVRLKAYAAAGFRKIDPRRLIFMQPDFRSAAEIAADGVRPLPLHLIIRICGREQEETIPGREVRAIVKALYAMYERELPFEQVAVARAGVAEVDEAEAIGLFSPTEDR